MDLPCCKCGEPYDLYSIYHDNDKPEISPDKAYKLYREKGCSAIFDTRCVADEKATMRTELYDLLGDDGDGMASLMDDFEYAGLI